jgi:hypothetical protein
MDRVRFGRALGYGARHAAKSLARAVDAATAPNPTAGTPQPPRVEPQQVVRQAAAATGQAKVQTKALGQSVLTPVKRFSSALWLEVTGTFFALIALAMGQSLWVRRAAITASPRTPEAQKLYLALVVFSVFAYFAISSFVRARRMGRK